MAAFLKELSTQDIGLIIQEDCHRAMQLQNSVLLLLYTAGRLGQQIDSGSRLVHSITVPDHHAVVRQELYRDGPWQWEEKRCM